MGTDGAALLREVETLHGKSYPWALACCAWNRPEADEVMQTVYLKILEGRARFDGRSALGTWLFSVIRKTAADRRRQAWLSALVLARLRVRQPAAEPAPPPDRDLDRSAWVQAALGALAARQREVLDLVFFHDMTIEEAARVMGVGLGTARVHYHRGKRRLAEKLR